MAKRIFLAVLIPLLLAGVVLGWIDFRDQVNVNRRAEENALRKTMGSLSMAADWYAVAHDNCFPAGTEAEFINRVMKIAEDRKVPTPTAQGWLSTKTVRSRTEALEHSKDINPGSVLYCPIAQDSKLIGYFILAKSPKGELIQNPKGLPLMLTPSETGFAPNGPKRDFHGFDNK